MTRNQVDKMVSVAWQYGEQGAYQRAARFLDAGDLVGAAAAAWNAVADRYPAPEEIFLAEGVVPLLEL